MWFIKLILKYFYWEENFYFQEEKRNNIEITGKMGKISELILKMIVEIMFL